LATNRLDVVFVFLDSGDKNLYQLKQWLQPLQRLSNTRNVTVLYVADEVTPLLADTGLGAAQVELPDGLVDFLNRSQPRLLLYANQNARNFFALRYGRGVHAWISHGESDKAYMFQNTLKRYDYYFAAGQAAEDRVLKNVANFSAARIKRIGRPQLADLHRVPSDYVDAPREVTSVLYAPTWEGASETTRYSSIATHGLELVSRLVELGCQVVYRPHPLAGSRDTEIARADRQIRELLARQAGTSATRNHYLDKSEFGWQLQNLDVMITDVSAVAYDWLSTGKPLIVTEPVSETAVITGSRLFDSVTRLSVGQLANLEQVLSGAREPAGSTLHSLADYYFEPSSDCDSLFHSAVEAALAEADGLESRCEVLEPFLPRGKRLGWLRYPNFALRLVCQMVGLWRPIANTATSLARTMEFSSAIGTDWVKFIHPDARKVFTYFSDPFDTKTAKAWAPVLYEEAAAGPIVLATNQVTTKLLLESYFSKRNREDAGNQRNLVVIACSSAQSSETLVTLLHPTQVLYLKDHPTNLALLRANGIEHVLWNPEVDPFFAVSHSQIMYDTIRTNSLTVRDAWRKFHINS